MTLLVDRAVFRSLSVKLAVATTTVDSALIKVHNTKLRLQ
jgi:hypothetical protein